eukprot:gb/GEZN01006440.1/.p2 GENE.gb/GEZN01006440.1/~~gb/GEZN01006440.1/.p2  ORF type:complete len:102 (-),score=2.14 gb/GEZN01006440.1/:597-902(-)
MDMDAGQLLVTKLEFERTFILLCRRHYTQSLLRATGTHQGAYPDSFTRANIVTAGLDPNEKKTLLRDIFGDGALNPGLISIDDKQELLSKMAKLRGRFFLR